MPELRLIFEALRIVGVDPTPLRTADTAHTVAIGQQVTSEHGIAGLSLAAAAVDDEIRVWLTALEGARIVQPVHLCMGLFEPTGTQKVRMDIRLKAGSSASFLAHCLFTRPASASHSMQADITIAAADDTRAEVIGITEGNAPGARGHVDRMEIVHDRAQVSANPLVRVSHPQAKVTHEAAIGSVDHQQLETLMTRGLTPDAAVDLIVRGLLRQS
ncbi:MAG: SufD family Fe-S cluster assembly protein [Candidatus Accumulibacter sp.]|uniref:SufD family Fe-S cluster assembly protein n=1 Tax=Candidatus Accumulibacter proximus TaxID=2954385 RepID=A0A935UI25_9PROT|nr:SufD family Fe-S cluster assembly protein [Candidatus Accumulibacter proximus]